jgi:hypothetical protein
LPDRTDPAAAPTLAARQSTVTRMKSRVHGKITGKLPDLHRLDFRSCILIHFCRGGKLQKGASQRVTGRSSSDCQNNGLCSGRTVVAPSIGCHCDMNENALSPSAKVA